MANIIKAEEVKGCRYRRVCKFGSDSCLSQDESDCVEITALYQNYCPLLVGDYHVDKKNCVCDIPKIRALWPAEKKCFADGVCLLRNCQVVREQLRGNKINMELIKEAFGNFATA